MSVTSQAGRSLFSNYTVTATGFVYNDSGSKAATSGWITCKSDHVIVQVGAPTLNASALTYRIEGRFDSLNRAASVLASKLTSPTSIDILHNIDKKFKEIRVGVKADNTATPNKFYAGVCLTDIK